MTHALPPQLLDAQGMPSAKYKAYQHYMQQWQAAKAAMDKAYQEALSNPMKLQAWPITGKGLQDQLDTAMRSWQGAGAKNEVETILAKK